MISRRRFLGSLGSAAALVAVAPGQLYAGPEKSGGGLWERWLPVRFRRRVDVADLVKSTFAPHLHTTFRFHLASDDRVDLELIEVADLRGPSSEDRFSLLFRGPATATFPQGIYELTHNQIGVFSIFVGPVGANQENAFYQAIFNRV